MRRQISSGMEDDWWDFFAWRKVEHDRMEMDASAAARQRAAARR